MNSNFTTVLKKKAIANVPSFNGMKANRIKVIANSPNYPNSVTLSMDAYCDLNTDGYVFYNAATGDTYALTAVDVSTALNSMIKYLRDIASSPSNRKTIPSVSRPISVSY